MFILLWFNCNLVFFERKISPNEKKKRIIRFWCGKHLAGGSKLLLQDESFTACTLPDGGVNPSGFSAMPGFF